MTDVPSKHVWKIKESCYVDTTYYVLYKLFKVYDEVDSGYAVTII